MRPGWLSAALVLFSMVRAISGEEALTSSSTMSAALLLAVPIGLAALGGLFSERAGVVNIGLEGMMILGTWGAGFAGYQWGWGAAIVGGVLFGALGGLLHALATVTFGVDHVVSGVAINILAAGVARFLSELLYTDNQAGGGVTQSPPVSSDPPSFSLPVLSSGPDLLGDLEQKHWFLVSDVAGIAARGDERGGGRDHPRRPAHPGDLPAPLADGVRPAAALVRREPGGGRLPRRARLPAEVHRGGHLRGLAGLGGVFLVFIAGIYREGQTNGRGFIGLAALIFGNWRPGGLAAGAGLFGFADALQLRSRTAVVALLLLVAVLLAGVAIWQATRRQALQAVLAAAVRRCRADRLPDHRRAAAGHRVLHPAPDHAAGALAGIAAIADAEGRRPGLPTRRALVSTGGG